MIAVMLGVPMPVAWSKPGLAGNDPLFFAKWPPGDVVEERDGAIWYAP